MARFSPLACAFPCFPLLRGTRAAQTKRPPRPGAHPLSPPLKKRRHILLKRSPPLLSLPCGGGGPPGRRAERLLLPVMIPTCHAHRPLLSCGRSQPCLCPPPASSFARICDAVSSKLQAPCFLSIRITAAAIIDGPPFLCVCPILCVCLFARAFSPSALFAAAMPAAACTLSHSQNRCTS